MEKAQRSKRLIVVVATVFLGILASTTLQMFVTQKDTPAHVLDDWQEFALSGVITGGFSGLFAGLLLALFFVRPEEVQHHSVIEALPVQNKETIIKQSQLSRNNNSPLVWGVAAGIVIGLCVQIIRLASYPAEFRSLAKVSVLSETTSVPVPGSPGYAEYYGRIIRDLKSSDLARKAMRRIKNLTPGVRERDVDIQVLLNKENAVLSILATSNEPKFTRAFLDALLDEYILLRLSQAQEAGHTTRNDVVVLERAIPALENIEDWTMPLFAGALNGTLAGILLGLLSKRLKRRRKVMETTDFAF
ncbi:MAG: hypothetical protein WAW39_05785 [Prosthecobacter sp.]|uniref:hypothetical protein n=1 Tax=Prosthecobacter sp. TaxID=1965333 RepID=UPI003BB21719